MQAYAASTFFLQHTMPPRPWQAFSGDRIPVQRLRILFERPQGAAFGASIRDLLSGVVPWVPWSRRKNGPKSRALFLPRLLSAAAGKPFLPLPSPPLSKKFSPRCTGTCKKGGSSVPFSKGFFSGRETLRRRPASAGRGPAGRACRLRRRQPQQAPASLPLMRDLSAAAGSCPPFPAVPPGAGRGKAEDPGKKDRPRRGRPSRKGPM